MTLQEAKIELGAAYNQALLSAKSRDASLADAFICKGQLEGLKYALSLLEKADGDAAVAEAAQ